MDCVDNTPRNKLFEDSPIIYIHIQLHMITFVVQWIQSKEQSYNFVLGCIVVNLSHVMNCTTLENIAIL